MGEGEGGRVGVVGVGVPMLEGRKCQCGVECGKCGVSGDSHGGSEGWVGGSEGYPC